MSDLRNRQTEQTTTDDVLRTRQKFAKALRHRVIDVLKVPEEEASKWIAKKLNIRWQTAQYWLVGKTFPLGHNLTRLGEAVGMNFRELIGPMTDDLEPTFPSWEEFLETPEGKSVGEEERWTLRLFPWKQPPSVGDYRQLLTLVRGNAERAG